MKSQILELRKQIYAYFKNRALELETRSRELDQYLADQNKMASREFNIIDIQKIQDAILDANIVYIGDFHTFDQNIRNVLRILKHVIKNNKKCLLGLEMIHQDYQVYIDAYLENHLTDLEFLDSIKYHDSWRFPWSHYRLIFELAKKHQIKVVGLNTKGNLKKRDEFASKIIYETNKADPETMQVILYGELHITKTKIPALVEKKSSSLKQIILHQNLDEVYWKLIEQDLQQGIVEFTPTEFCLITAPPWVKYESMIYWYENLCDDPDFDIHEYIIENGKKTFSEDTSEQFHSLCTELNQNLRLNLEDDDLENFNLYDHTNLEYIEEKIENQVDKKQVGFYEYLLSNGHSFRLPAQPTYYCSNYSMNRIAYLAGIHLLYCALGESGSRAKNHEHKNQFFAQAALEAMCAHFFSKIINPHRKCDMYLDLVEKEQVTESLFEKQYLSLSIQVLRGQEIINVENHSLSSLFESAISIGHIMGEYLYQTYTTFDKKKALSEFMAELKFEKSFFENLLKSLLETQTYLDHKKRTF